MNRPGPPCSICTHTQRDAIDAALGSIADVAARFALSPSTLGRHRQHAATPAGVEPTMTHDPPAVARTGRPRRPARGPQDAAGAASTASTGNFTININGALYFNSATTTFATSAQQPTIFGDGSGNSYPMSVRMIVAYSRILSAQERATVLGGMK
jgi:hypothetical protein